MTRPLNPQVIPRPLFPYDEFQSWLGSTHYFAIEIGCGVGLHPIQWAQSHPSSKILAIERTTDKFQKFKRRLDKHPELQNIFFAHADAALLLPHILHGPSVDEYYVLYPNPYPKTKHKNLRFGFSPLSLFMAQTLKPGGQVTFATNILGYANELKKEIPFQTGLTLIEDRVVAASDKPRTHFEKKYLLRGDSCRNLVFRKLEPA